MSKKSQRTSTKHTGKTEGDFTTGASGNGSVLSRDGGLGWKRIALQNQKLEALRKSLDNFDNFNAKKGKNNG